MRKIGWLALFCLALATYLGKSWETSLPPNDSAFHATVALHATEKGWIPQLPIPGIRSYNTSDAAGFNDHPFPLFVLDGMIQRKLGPGGFSARLLPALLAAGTILLTAALGGALESAALGWTAALLLLFTPEYIKSAASFHLDVPMIFPILLSFWLWRKGKWSLAGLAAGLGCWIKTPVSLLVVPVAACVIFLRREKALRGSWIRMALVALLSAGSYWVLVRAIAGPEIVRDYWVRQVWGTAVGGRGGGERDLGMFFSYLRHHFLPWVLLLLPSAYVIWRDKLWRRDSVLIPLVAIAILAIVISPMRFKYDYYFLPAFPFLTLICAQSFRKWLPAWEPALPTAILMTALAMVTFLLTTPVE
ncbi:MAG: ArnT family glycosyltransferase, partial [Bdellovibrionota bacterium]